MIVDFISLMFPEVCCGCGEALHKGETTICTSCKLSLPFTDYHLEPRNPVWKRFLGKVDVRRAHSFLFFVKHGRVQNMLHELKYKGNQEVAELLGRWYGSILQETGDAQYDLILPVPMHLRKQKKRGYNQVDPFARGLADALQTEWNPRGLLKVDETESQTRKGRFDRWKNVKQVFVTNADQEIGGKRILLVDDVITTGSTLEACVSVLNRQSPRYIDVVTIACAT